MFTHDADFLVIAARWLREGRNFAGLIFAAQEGIPYGTVIEDLQIITATESPAAAMNNIYYLPL